MILKRIKNMPRGAKASIAFFLTSVVTKGIAYLVMPIYTRILSPEVFGQTSIYMTWLEIFGIFAMFCLSYGVFNNGMIDNPEQRDEYSFSMLVLSNIITLIFTIVIIALYPLIKKIIGLDLALIILMCIVFLFQPAYNFWSTRQRYELKYKHMVVWTIISAIASPTVAVVCILTAKGDVLYARLFGAELTLVAIYIVFYVYLGIKSKFKVQTKFWKQALLFNLPLLPHYLSIYLLGNSNKLLISNIVGDAEVAYYSIAQSVASIALILWTAINSSLIPYTYEKCKEKDYKAISKVATPILTAFGALCLVVMMFAPEVVKIMATSDYESAIYAIPPIVGGVFFQVQYFLYANVVYYYKKPKYVMFASITAVLINFGLGILLINKFGYLAAGYATLISYFVQATLDYVAMRKATMEKVYNMKFIGLLSLIVIIVSICASFLYNNIYVRYGIIALVIIAAIVFRKKLINLLRDMRENKKEKTNEEDSLETSCKEEKTNEQDGNNL